MLQPGVWGLLTRDTPNALTTITEIYDSGMRAGKDAPFLGRRPLISTNPVKYAPYYEWQTWGQVDHRRRCVGSALSLLFKTGKLGGAGELETVGIWAMNRPGAYLVYINTIPSVLKVAITEWQIVDLAIATYGKVDVSIYDTLGKDVVGEFAPCLLLQRLNVPCQNICNFVPALFDIVPLFICSCVLAFRINHSHVTSVFTSADHIPTLLKLKPKIPMLKAVVSMDDFTAETRTILTQWGWSVGVHVMDMKECKYLTRAHIFSVLNPR